MGTPKRERQKANRQYRLQEMAKDARKRKSKRVGLRVGLIVGAVVAIVALVNILGGDDDEATAPTTTVSVSTVPVSTLPTPDKPEVSLPAELPTELVVTELIAGSGREVVAGDTVEVHYIGVLSADGTEFDNSYDRGTPFPVTVGSSKVIVGWHQGLVGVQAGGRYQFDIPAELAYGDVEQGPIPANSPLTFVVDIMSVTAGA